MKTREDDGSLYAIGTVAALSAIGFLLGRTTGNDRPVAGSRLWLGPQEAADHWYKTYGKSVKDAFRDGREAPHEAVEAWKNHYFYGDNYDKSLKKILDSIKDEVRRQGRQGSRLLLTGPSATPPGPRDCRRRRQILEELRQEISPGRRSALQEEYRALVETYGAPLWLC